MFKTIHTKLGLTWDELDDEFIEHDRKVNDFIEQYDVIKTENKISDSILVTFIVYREKKVRS